MKANPGKYHLLLSGSDSSKIAVGNQCSSKKASQKINALSLLASSVKFEQRRLIMISFVICHFSYCPVVWMFHDRKPNARINRLHKRALQVVYRDFNSSFEGETAYTEEIYKN